jgi:toxin ParE1/3/4
MAYEVLLTASAQRDLEDIDGHIAESGSPAKAHYVLTWLLEAANHLTAFPDRGSHPKELQALGIRHYRQTFSNPYRVMDRVIGRKVFIYLIADGRRDMQSLLQRRLLGASSRRALRFILGGRRARLKRPTVARALRQCMMVVCCGRSVEGGAQNGASLPSRRRAGRRWPVRENGFRVLTRAGEERSAQTRTKEDR